MITLGGGHTARIVGRRMEIRDSNGYKMGVFTKTEIEKVLGIVASPPVSYFSALAEIRDRFTTQINELVAQRERVNAIIRATPRVGDYALTQITRTSVNVGCTRVSLKTLRELHAQLPG